MSRNSLKHIAIIMDGNGRWAQERAHRRIWGHIRGVNVVTEVVERASQLNLEALTLYAFSTENFGRPKDEVSTLFRLLKKYLKVESKRIIKNNLRFKVLGDYSFLDAETRDDIAALEKTTIVNTGMILNLAFGYGGRKELVDAIQKMVDDKSPITEESVSAHLYNPASGDVDLMIRTGGDQRISNFLLWQVAYAELYFTNIKWPEFSGDHLEKIIAEVSGRERRYGGVGGNVDYKDALDHARANKQELKR